MKETLKPGLVVDFRRLVGAGHTVPGLLPESPEFQRMPQVLATGCMVGLLEWACIVALKPHLDWPREQTLGVGVEFSHLAPTPPGLTVRVRGSLVEVAGRRLTFTLRAHDGVDLISEGVHQRHVIDFERFAAKAAAKARAAGGWQ